MRVEPDALAQIRLILDQASEKSRKQFEKRLQQVMARIDERDLIDMALLALEEVAASCHVGPVPRTRALAMVLAYLASRRPQSTREPFDSFWRAVSDQRPQDRWAQVNAALNGIYLVVA